jgi:hypothetical protein
VTGWALDHGFHAQNCWRLRLQNQVLRDQLHLLKAQIEQAGYDVHLGDNSNSSVGPPTKGAAIIKKSSRRDRARDAS